MAEYYAQRASAGLMITKGAPISQALSVLYPPLIMLAGGLTQQRAE